MAISTRAVAATQPLARAAEIALRRAGSTVRARACETCQDVPQISAQGLHPPCGCRQRDRWSHPPRPPDSPPSGRACSAQASARKASLVVARSRSPDPAPRSLSSRLLPPYKAGDQGGRHLSPGDALVGAGRAKGDAERTGCVPGRPARPLRSGPFPGRRPGRTSPEAQPRCRSRQAGLSDRGTAASRPSAVIIVRAQSTGRWSSINQRSSMAETAD